MFTNVVKLASSKRTIEMLANRTNTSKSPSSLRRRQTDIFPNAIFCREDREITVHEPRTVMETREIKVPVTIGSGMYGSIGYSSMGKSSAAPTDPNLIYQQPTDDAISA